MMNTSMQWKATPRERRMLADVAHVLSKAAGSDRRIALMVGAGLDRQLTGRALWPGFVRELGKVASSRPETRNSRRSKEKKTHPGVLDLTREA
jgi:hypothetical protein